jgi:hypothetical protein
MSMSLFQALERVARRFRNERLFSSLALCWLVWALVGCGMKTAWFQESVGLIEDWWLPAGLAGMALITGVLCVAWAQMRARDPRWVARRIEAKHPELKTGLLAAVEEVKASPSGQLGFLQYAVVKEVLEHRRKQDWNETVPTWSLRGAMMAHAAALLSLLAVLGTLSPFARSDVERARSIKSVTAGTGVAVDPGNTELERGTSLLVVARFHGAVPAEANLIVENLGQQKAQRGMTRSLEDPTFAGRVESVETDIAYRVEYGGKSTDTFQVKVFEYPELVRTDARLIFPRYTSLEPKTVEDIRHVTAVEGTELTLLCRLNKEVATARLVDAENKSIELKGDQEGRHVYRATMTLADPRRFKVELVDKDGRTNKLISEIVVNVTRNHPPVVKVTQPAHDVRVSPVEELKLKADIEDDFGLTRHGLSYSTAGGEPREIVLNSPPTSKRQVHAQHLLDFEALHAIPDQVVTYFFWGEDVGPDGQPRRTSGDMFFADVRHFEEIFRQGEQPPGGSAQEEQQEGGQDNARDSDQLAELEKEIINGTWKLVRRESGAKPTDKLAEDGKVLKEAQQSAIEKADQLAERLQDAASKASLEQATRLMKDAEKRLTEVADNSSIAALNPALAAEQAAYQALLKLRAREFQVIRNNSRRQQQSGRNSGGRMAQRQLQQLELTADENRYEEQRSARAREENLSQREREQRETGQVLNRLRELAQRQSDVNERLKELQSALEAAKTAQARQEIDRQLKRLRDQQQQILRDTDELRERMEQEENRERMAQAREQIEQGREHVRQASEALEQGQLGQALTEGARAGRQLNDLREDLRKTSANRFTEEATDMRNQARQLSQDQQKLTEKLESDNQAQQHSLRDSGERKQVREGLEQQEKRLDHLLEQMRNTVQDAEESEPLLAKELYDTVRKAGEQKIPDALKVSQQLVDLGVSEDAAKTSRHAAQGLEQLREGVERAARSVLGDETAALERAGRELEDLGDQLDREIAQATGNQPSKRNRNASRPSPGQGRDAVNSPNRQQQQGKDSQGEGRQGEDQQKGQQGASRQPRGGPREKGQRPGQEEGRQDQGQPQPGEQEDPQDGQQGPGEQQGPQGQQGGGQGQQGGGEQQGQQGGGQGQQGGEEQQGQQGEQGGQGQQAGQAGRRGGQQGQQGQGPRRLRGGNRGEGEQRQQGDNNGSRTGGPGGGNERQAGLTGPGNPIRGEGFRQWTDRMRDVEELLDDPEMRAEAARLRDRVRGERDEYKRHSKEPDWKKLRDLVAEPMNELRNRIAEEVRRRVSPDALVPIDRDPVPPQFAESVRRYYERLGSGK